MKKRLPAGSRFFHVIRVLAEFRRLRRKKIKSVFPTDMRGRKNTSQRASVRAQRVHGSALQKVVPKGTCLWGQPLYFLMTVP